MTKIEQFAKLTGELMRVGMELTQESGEGVCRVHTQYDFDCVDKRTADHISTLVDYEQAKAKAEYFKK